MPKKESENKRGTGWCKLHHWFVDEYGRVFGKTGSCVFFSLSSHADSEGKCFPSEKKIAEEWGMSERIVRPYIALLKWSGVIVIEKGGRNSYGQWRHNSYTINDRGRWKSPEEIISYRNQRKIKTSPQENNSTIQRQTFPINKNNEKNTHKRKTHNAKQGFANVDKKTVDLIIDMFSIVNPSNYKIYDNLTQRKCVARIVTNVGIERLSKIIKILPRTNKMKYAPVITTPYELEQKWAKLEAYMGQYGISSEPSRFENVRVIEV